MLQAAMVAMGVGGSPSGSFNHTPLSLRSTYLALLLPCELVGHGVNEHFEASLVRVPLVLIRLDPRGLHASGVVQKDNQ